MLAHVPGLADALCAEEQRAFPLPPVDRVNRCHQPGGALRLPGVEKVKLEMLPVHQFDQTDARLQKCMPRTVQPLDRFPRPGR